MNWIILHLNELAEIATIGASIAAIVGLFIGGFTIYFGKKNLDILLELRRKDALRNAVVMAVQKTEWFGTIFLKEAAAGLAELRKSTLSKNVGVEFNSQVHSITVNKKNKNKKLIDETTPKLVGLVIDFANQLESFAMPFECGVASSDLAFPPVGKPYCEIVEELFKFFPLFVERGEINSYQNMFGLYCKWKKMILHIDAQKDLDMAAERYNKTTKIDLARKEYI